MSRIQKLFGLAVFFAMLIFNAIAFIPAGTGSNLFWPAYAFTMAALALQIFIAYIAFPDFGNMKKVFLGLPVAYAGFGYLGVQALLGVAGLFSPFVSPRTYVAICAVTLGFYGLIIVMAAMGREAIQATGETTKAQTQFMKNLLLKCENLRDAAEDNESKKLIGSIVDKIRYSDPMSPPALGDFDTQITFQFGILQNAVASKEYASVKEHCRLMGQMLEERRRRILLSK